MKTINFKGGKACYPVYENTVELFKSVESLATALKLHYGDIKLGLVCRGTSGISICTALSAYSANWHVIFIRKDDDDRHSKKSVHADRIEANNLNHELVFIDDLISSGDTFFRCYESIRTRFGIDTIIDGIALVEPYSGVYEFIQERIKEKGFELPTVNFYNIPAM